MQKVGTYANRKEVEDTRRRAAPPWLCALLAAAMLALGTLTFLGPRGRAGGAAAPPVLACYYDLPGGNTTRGLRAPLSPADVDPHLCTHINAGFANVRDNRLHLEPDQVAALRDLVRLRASNPDLKVLLSVGGSGEDDGFPAMVVDHASRKSFIRSVKSALADLALDGVDLDWEFPAVRVAGAAGRGGGERVHFAQLLRELRAEFTREGRGALLTVALAAPSVIAHAAYDVPAIDANVDFANLMTYDFHFYSSYTPFTGLNAPLFARAGERLYLATLNANSTVAMYAAAGLSPARMALGVPTYGRTFRLVNPRNTGIGSPAAGVGALGAAGFVDYPDVCRFLRAGATARRDAAARVPYLFRGAEWASYDDELSAGEKARWARGAGLRGVMLYSLNADDAAGACGAGRFPLAGAARAALRGDGDPPAGRAPRT